MALLGKRRAAVDGYVARDCRIAESVIGGVQASEPEVVDVEGCGFGAADGKGCCYGACAVGSLVTESVIGPGMRNEAAGVGASVDVCDGEAVVCEVVVEGSLEGGADASEVELGEG